jgi:cobalamin-dependent methionine synthase I
MEHSDSKAVVASSSALIIKDELWDQADMIVAVVVTLGEEPENRVNELFNSGQLEKGLILDTLVSTLVDYCAKQIYRKIIKNAEKDGLAYTGMIIPGGADFTFSYQEKLLKLVDLTPIGVSVTSKLMMKPVKSTSFLTLLGKNVDQHLGCSDCKTCSKRNKCEYGKFEIFNY